MSKLKSILAIVTVLCLAMTTASLAQDRTFKKCTIEKGAEIIVGVLFEDGSDKVAAGILAEDCEFLMMKKAMLPWPPNSDSDVLVAGGTVEQIKVIYKGREFVISPEALYNDFHKHAQTIAVFTPFENVSCDDKVVKPKNKSKLF